MISSYEYFDFFFKVRMPNEFKSTKKREPIFQKKKEKEKARTYQPLLNIGNKTNMSTARETRQVNP